MTVYEGQVGFEVASLRCAHGAPAGHHATPHPQPCMPQCSLHAQGETLPATVLPHVAQFERTGRMTKQDRHVRVNGIEEPS